MTECKHPEIEVELIGQDGNAFMVLGLVNRALTRAGIPKTERDQFMAEATAGDYDHLLGVVMQWVTIKGPGEEDENLDEFDDEDFDGSVDEADDDLEEIEDEFADEDEETTIADLVDED